jgi:outer membrane lipase/esterase
MLRSFFCRCVAVVSIILPAPAVAGPFSALYVLGDSLSDQGNLFLATSAVAGPANALPASDHYFNGRFSNGPAYTDVLAQKLGLPLAPSLLGGNNFAFGGARTTYNTVETTAGGFLPPGLFPWSLNAETEVFKSRGIHDPGALYVVFSGSNDIADMARGVNPTAITTTLAGVLNAIDAFKLAGARRIVVPNVPDLGLTPAFRISDDASKFATALSIQYNTLLDAALDTISDVDIIEFDTFQIVRNIIQDPETFGLSNVTTPCYSGFVVPNPSGTECANPDEFFFWDIVHPTRTVHALLADAIFVSVVPVPSTLPLALIGLAILTGVKIRARMGSKV